MVRGHSRITFPYGKGVAKEWLKEIISYNEIDMSSLAKLNNRKTRYAKHDEFKVDFYYKENDDDLQYP